MKKTKYLLIHYEDCEIYFPFKSKLNVLQI